MNLRRHSEETSKSLLRGDCINIERVGEGKFSFNSFLSPPCWGIFKYTPESSLGFYVLTKLNIKLKPNHHQRGTFWNRRQETFIEQNC